MSNAMKTFDKTQNKKALTILAQTLSACYYYFRRLYSLRYLLRLKLLSLQGSIVQLVLPSALVLLCRYQIQKRYIVLAPVIVCYFSPFICCFLIHNAHSFQFTGLSHVACCIIVTTLLIFLGITMITETKVKLIEL